MLRIAFQIGLVLLPFVLFAIYRIATRDKNTFSQQWPFAALTLTGLLLTSAFYGYYFFKEPRGERTCVTPPRFENGQIIPSEVVPCEKPGIDSRGRD
jgi:predicted permease